mgnify:CR=1 FL=1
MIEDLLNKFGKFILPPKECKSFDPDRLCAYIENKLSKKEKEEFEKHNILFQEDETYIQKIFEKAGIVKNE